MPLLDNVRRINSDEYPEETRNTVDQLANTLNFFMEDVVNILNGRVDFANLNRELLTLTITVNNQGVPITESKFSSQLNVAGTKIIRAENLDNNAVFPTTAPFISYRNTGTGIYVINNISGLQPGNKYRLVIEIIEN